MKYCPNCGAEAADGARFCRHCGQLLPQPQGTPEAQPQSQPRAAQPQPTKPKIKPVGKRPDLYDSATAALNKYTGEEGAVKVNLIDLFSEVPKHHTKDEAEAIFIAGTKNTTPTLSDISDDWAKPWLFSRILVGFLLAFAALWVMAAEFQNANAIPGLILVGAFAVPFSGLVFFFEADVFKDVSLFDVVKVFFIGGVFALIVTLFLYQFVSFSMMNRITGALTVTDSLSVGLVEELGKFMITLTFIDQLRVRHVLDGILIGAAVGAGFAAFETAGYIYGSGNHLLEVAVLRGWSAIGGHLVWAAIAGGAFMVVKRQKAFQPSQLIDVRFLIFFLLAVLMHAAWDWDFTLFGSYTLKLIALIVLAWMIVFVLMNAGLKEITHLQEAGIKQP